jgi:tetratricopeptide (TPR) repeat protein
MLMQRLQREVSKRAEWIFAISLVLVCAIAFAPALRGRFVDWDDYQNFVTNYDFRGLGWSNLKWAWSTTLLGHYVPLSWMSLEADFAMWGMNPHGYHITSLLIHIANVLLLYAAAQKILRMAGAHSPDFTAWAGALLFAVHPLRVESVAWITERRDVLSLFFTLVALLSYLRHVREERVGRWYWATCLSFAAGLLSKASVVTFPVILLVLNWFPLNRFKALGRRHVIVELSPMFAMSIATGIMSIVALDAGPQLEPLQKLAVSAYALALYVVKTVWPARLAPLYPMPQTIRPFAAPFLAAYVATILAAVMLWRSRIRRPGLVAASLMSVVLVLPFLGAVQNGSVIAADRYTYLAAIPVSILLAVGLERVSLLRRGIAVLAIASLLTVLSRQQSKVWVTTEALWSRVLEVDSTSYAAFNGLGAVVAERGESGKAIEYFRRSIELNPNYAGSYNNLGYELANLGQIDEAIVAYRAALRLQPEFADAEANLGNAMAFKGRYEEAISHYQRATAVAPNRAGVEFNWALALYRSGRLREAKERLETTLALDPQMPDARALYGTILHQLRIGP